MGYQTAVQKVTVSKENVKKTIIRLKAEVKSLDEVVVMGKSEARKIREQAMPVTVYSMSQLQGTVNSVEDRRNHSFAGSSRQCLAYLCSRLGRQAYWILYRRSTDER